jgi:para-aminobenzoate synthetase component 1
MKQKVLNWLQQFDTFCFLDNHQYQINPHTVECLIAAGEKRRLQVHAGTALLQLQEFIDVKQSWLFGHLGYDLKNEIEKLTTAKKSGIQFPDLFFYEPEIIIRLAENEIMIDAVNANSILEEIINSSPSPSLQTTTPVIKNRISKEEYIEVVKKLQEHILRGDCYEINFCHEFFAEQALIDPIEVYIQLSDFSPNPFSALYKMNNQWLICASPERFIKKQGDNILSQPIKGTARRVIDNKYKDEVSRNELFNSAKDRSENVMVVDLVRNDLAKVCAEGTVQVDELYGIYSFPQVHQMISTVSGKVKANTSFTDIIKATFPMGSMTGAPKRSVMGLIEQYEQTKRGIFSGAVGYISPEGDFDFNVVIRSIMYNADTAYLSFQTGSAITYYSDPENEWEECLLKAKAIKTVLGSEE